MSADSSAKHRRADIAGGASRYR